MWNFIGPQQTALNKGRSHVSDGCKYTVKVTQKRAVNNHNGSEIASSPVAVQSIGPLNIWNTLER